MIIDTTETNIHQLQYAEKSPSNVVKISVDNPLKKTVEILRALQRLVEMIYVSAIINTNQKETLYAVSLLTASDLFLQTQLGFN